MKKLIIILIIMAIIAALGYFGYQEYAKRTATEALSDLQTTEVEIGNLTATVGATGVVRSNQTADLQWKTSGTVKEVNASVGDRVAQGDILAVLEQTSLPQNVILAQADLATAQKSLEDLYTNARTAKTEAIKSISTYTKSVRDAQYTFDNYTVPSNQANLDAVEALSVMEEQLNQARQAFEPYKHLSSSNQTRQDLKDELEQAQSDYDSAVKRLEYEYELQAAKDNLIKAREDFEKWKDGPDPEDIAAQEARISAAEATIRQAWIEAPFEGTITEANPKVGDQVSANLEAFRLDDFARLVLDVQVSEVDVNRIHPGQEALLSFDAILDKEYSGKVIEVAPVGNSNQGVVEFVVTVEVTDADENIKPGMTAAVNIIAERIEDVLLVPNRAVRFKDGRRIVYILVNGELVPVPITLGSSSETMSEVIDGELETGDIIVLNPPLEFDQSGPPPFVR
jgi:HlyD family secretion protein